jgi:hypothetical protein
VHLFLTIFYLSDRLVCMTNQSVDLSEDLLESVGSLRHRVRTDRHNFWFPLVLFGVITLLSTPLYYGWPYHFSNNHCSQLANGTLTCSGTFFSASGYLTSGFAANQLGGWLTLFWVTSLLFGYVATIWFYRHRASTVGLSLRTWPAAVVGLGLLVLALSMQTIWRSIEPSYLASGDFWMRGTAILVILSVGIMALSLLERSIAYLVYSLGFVALALLVSLYNVSNLVQWVGLGRFITGSNQATPNVVIPALYLLIGGFFFWAVQHDSRDAVNDVQVVNE